MPITTEIVDAANWSEARDKSVFRAGDKCVIQSQDVYCLNPERYSVETMIQPAEPLKWKWGIPEHAGVIAHGGSGVRALWDWEARRHIPGSQRVIWYCYLFDTIPPIGADWIPPASCPDGTMFHTNRAGVWKVDVANNAASAENVYTDFTPPPTDPYVVTRG